MKFILGKKIEMTQKFMADGRVVPVTAVLALPCFIIDTKNYKDVRAIQIGTGHKKKLNKPLSGQLKGLANFREINEFRLDEKDKNNYERGQKITVDVFAKGDIVNVVGESKGRGFQGVVKRHGFRGHNRTHGTKDQERHSGSVGSTGVGHTFKGTRMSGRMGGDQITVKNLEIVDIDNSQNLLFVKGALPGARNGTIRIIAPGEMKLTKDEVGENTEEKKEIPVIKEENK